MIVTQLPAIARTLAVTLGAYTVTAVWTAALSHILASSGVMPVQAVIAATLPSFAFFAVTAMMAFHARSPARAWIWLAVAALPAAALLV